MIEFRFDIDERKHENATADERMEYMTRLFQISSIATTDYGAVINWSNPFHWIIRVPEDNAEKVRQLFS